MSPCGRPLLLPAHRLSKSFDGGPPGVETFSILWFLIHPLAVSWTRASRRSVLFWHPRCSPNLAASNVGPFTDMDFFQPPARTSRRMGDAKRRAANFRKETHEGPGSLMSWRVVDFFAHLHHPAGMLNLGSGDGPLQQRLDVAGVSEQRPRGR